MAANTLTAEKVHHIRASGLPDIELAALYNVSETSIRMARRGRTWASHPTPPDRRPRQFGHLKHTRIDWSKVPVADITPVRRDLYDRLRARCELDADGCWIWQGAIDSSLERGSAGHHGHTSVDGKSTGTHRAMWIAVHGPIPDGLSVCHECDKPLCIRPDCLWLGTHADNMRDSIIKGRHVNVRKSNSTATT